MSQQTTYHMWDFIHEILHIDVSNLSHGICRWITSQFGSHFDFFRTQILHRSDLRPQKYTSHPLILDSTEIVMFKVCREVIWCLNPKINCFISPYRGLYKWQTYFKGFECIPLMKHVGFLWNIHLYEFLHGPTVNIFTFMWFKHLTGISEALLPRYLSYFRAIGKVYLLISRLRNFTRSFAETSVS